MQPILSRRHAIALAGSTALAPLMGCGEPVSEEPPAEASANDEFAALSAAWLEALARGQPAYATQLGDHRFDAQLTDVSAGARTARLQQTRATREALLRIDRSQLTRDNQVDAAMLADALDAELFTVERLQSWAWDPLIYAAQAGGALYSLVARDFAPLPERLDSAARRMEQFPTLLAETRRQLDPERVPAIHAETYSGQNAGAVSIIDDLILAQAESLGPNDRARLVGAAEKAKAALAEHQTWIDAHLMPNAKGDFRLGPLYDAQLRHSISSDIPRAELAARARADADEIRAEMLEIAGRLVANTPAASVIARMAPDAQRLATIAAALRIASEDRPPRDQLMARAKTALDEATAFVREFSLITLPDAPVKIIEMPKFQQGVAVAYCDSPGPLDRHLETFYAISPIPEAWTDQQTRSFLSEYNTHMLYELSIHEAMPGHYLQIWHSNKHPSVTRAVLSSGTFVEGWACYAEDMMIQQGFGAADPLRRLTNLKMRLRSVTNAILDQGVHVEGWDEETAMRFMTQEAFQEEREAAGKWTRARVSAGQLSTYYVGWGEHHALRREAEQKLGVEFSLRKYHDAVLSYGSPPLRFVRQLMFDEPII